MEKVPEHFTNLLENIAKEQHFDKYDLNIKPISSGGANYTTKLFLVTITEGTKVLELFAKIAAVGEKMRSQAPLFYATELFAYTSLATTYNKLQEENQVPQDLQLSFPKFYGSNPKDYEETIVLENLVKAGYSSYDRFKSVDWPYASSAITELSKFHALSFAHAKYHPEDFEKETETYKFEMKFDDPDMKTYFDNVVMRAIQVTREEHRGKLQAFFESFNQDEFMNFYKPNKSPVLGHGDYRPSNLMHKIFENGKLEIKILDLQTLQKSGPVTDLLYFIVTGSDEKFRAQYYDKLIDHYYTQLSEAMKRLNLNPDEIYSREDFTEELKEKLPCGLVLAVFTLPLVTVEAENAPVVSEELNIADFSIQKTSELYIERLNGVVNDYVNWGILT